MSLINLQVKNVHRMFSAPALVLGTALLLTACGGSDEHEVKAIDKVEEAAELARANAPEPEPLNLEDIETVPAAEGEADAEAGTDAEADADATDAADAEADVATAEAADTAEEQPAMEEATEAAEEPAAE
ncbi:hypothetical protein [Psychrobacter sp. FDAARGOS_221]|uniref:hypothetical protein n=1 Tax=Psychrobacter sp. FDAARGOS_221 TaxID=1975705 RepID=UPI000BB5884F|nr:hypothetical protein [Psychrobacter sp. FDAARGOS_221]PNK60392.1 hypothetical protein A6J60_005575 [Psychrobacter sp. FDAARGOS_221]